MLKFVLQDVAQAKKDAKLNRTRDLLLKLPEMARIKLRVTSGLVEVSLVRVIEERNTVEVLWDGGLKNMFESTTKFRFKFLAATGGKFFELITLALSAYRRQHDHLSAPSPGPSV